MNKQITIPDHYYQGGQPKVLKENDGVKLLYRTVGEEAYELAAAFGGHPDNQCLCVFLLSPYFFGFDNEDYKNVEFVSIDLENRKFEVKEDNNVN